MVKNAQEKGNVLIVDLKNDVQLAYERVPQKWERDIVDQYGNVLESRLDLSYRIRYAMLPQYGQLCGGDNAQLLEPQKKERPYCGFSEGARRIIDATLEERTAQYRKVVTSLYDRITEPLSIKEYRHRNWEEIKLGAGMILGWPVLMPYMLFSKKNHGSGALGVVLAPFMTPIILKELFVPSKKSKKITNRKLLSDESGENKVGLNSWAEFSTKKFQYLRLTFPNGAELTEGHFFPDRDDRKAAQKIKHYITVDPRLMDEVYQLEAREKYLHEQTAQMRRTLQTQDHVTLLKHLKFYRK